MAPPLFMLVIPTRYRDIMNTSSVQKDRAAIEQLRREATIKRIPVSVAVADIIRFKSEHHQEDCLLVGFTNQKVNPFREKSSWTVL
ncbi:guanine nucleotide-binding protein subunit gamma-1-like [Leptidea sinapis]|uniref:guanine nucleotide-binding protein subunit gamma-1-like n=1 Tax=Leptidea sinapis TaxID=189913 RepID=UPI0021C3EF8E|nr:guanine nucleotide-binding protein subunit gamma-1-like [Leptidea sinapis]